MFGSSFRSAVLLGAVCLLGGCASLPNDAGRSEAQALVDARRAAPLQWQLPPDVLETHLLAQPLGVDGATQLAFLRNPRLQQEYARLGLASADVFDAGRLANPRIGYSYLDLEDGDGSKITRGISMDFAGLLLVPARKRLAQGEFEGTQQEVAAALLGLAAEVEAAWYGYVAARQVTTMREAIARAGDAAAELAQRFHDAGNISALQLALEQAAGSTSRVAAVRAAADEVRARSVLAGLMGVPTDGDWQVPAMLPAPTPAATNVELVAQALGTRLDLEAARRTVATLEGAGESVRGMRLLGEVQIGYERETETDGAHLDGPTLELQLPIFNQGQGAVVRADAQLADARARLAALELSVRNEVILGQAQLASAREIVERYRAALLPQREAVVARTQEEVNYMLKGVFELIRARQDEFDAYQEYLEAVRDFWLARTELRRVAGGRLPDDGAPLEATLGVDMILPPSGSEGGMDHSAHGSKSGAEDGSEEDKDAAQHHHPEQEETP